MRRPMRSRGAAMGCLLAAGALAVGLASPATGATPTPTITWPAPGANAASAQPLSIGGTSLTVRPLRNPLVLVDENVEPGTAQSFTLGADVLFDTGKDTLTASAGGSLSALASKITDEGITGKAAVVGNTDDVGSTQSNLELSKRRANAVSARLTELLTGKDITLSAVGKGESDPLVPNSSDANRSRNRRVSVIFSGTKRERDVSDIHLPSTQPAASADASQAPEGSIAGTERTLTLGRDDPKTWRVRLDVTGVRPIGSTMIAIDTEVSVISGPSGSSFTDYNALFSGSTYNSQAYAPAIYDKPAGQLLPVVIDGQGKLLSSDHNQFIEPGTTADDWQLFPRPKDLSAIQLYIPAFGVLTIPAKG